MPLPETVRVKLSSEEAGTVAITPVVVQDLPLRELVERMLGVTGKDPARVRELFLRGSLVSGASRFRWSGFDADLESVTALLSDLPDSDPALPFAPERCLLAVFHGPGCRIELSREAGNKRRLLRRKSFWDLFLEVLADEPPRYVAYSYKEKADCYRLALSHSTSSRIRETATLLPFKSLGRQIRGSALEWVELFVERIERMPG